VQNVKEFHRPQGLADAVALLQRKDTKTVVLGGGTWLAGEGPRDIEAVVDVADLGLGKILVEGDRVRIGAAATHQQLVEHDVLGRPVPGALHLIGETAEAMSGLNIRNRATIAGAIVTADASSPLVTALLACAAEVVVAGTKDKTKSVQSTNDFYRVLPLAGFLSYRQQVLAEGLIITEVRVPVPVGDMKGSYARVARTPKDYPIVCAAASLSVMNGVAHDVRIAVGGIAPTPIRLNHLEFALEHKPLAEWLDKELDAALQDVQPKGDWQGSAEYRKDMARVLVRRVALACGSV
jgi:aerobic carbon-monoxide dehydrogenase medium subunit